MLLLRQRILCGSVECLLLGGRAGRYTVVLGGIETGEDGVPVVGLGRGVALASNDLARTVALATGDAGFEVVEAVVTESAACRLGCGSGGGRRVEDGVELIEAIFSRGVQIVISLVIPFFGFREIVKLVVEVVKGSL